MPLTPYPWLFTAPVELDTALTLGLTVGLTGSGSATLDTEAGVAPYPTIPAGRYSFPAFLAITEKKIRDWFVAAAAADPNVAGPVSASVLFKIGLPDPLVVGVNGNPLTITFDPAGFTVGGGAATCTSLAIVNTGTVQWGSLLSFDREAVASIAASIAGGKATLVAKGQSRFLFVAERAGWDTGEREIVRGKTRVLRDGKVRNHLSAQSRAIRTLTLTDQDDGVLGPPINLATVAAGGLDGTRQIISLHTTDEVGLVGISDVWQFPDQWVAGAYYRVGLSRHAARLESRSPGAGTSTSATLLTKVPLDVDATVWPGRTLRRISELEAFLLEVRRNGGRLLVHEPDDTTGKPRWRGESYSLAFDGDFDFGNDRVDEFFTLFDFALPLVRRDDPELTLV